MTPNSEDDFDPWDDSHIEKAHSIIQASPDSPVGYSILGEILYYREKYDEAITHLRKAAEIMESIPLPPMSRDSPDGELIYSYDNVKYIMHVNSTYSILGDCHLRLKNPEEGEIWIKKALDVADATGIRPIDEEGQWARYGQALARQNKWLEAVQPIRTAVTKNPSKEFFWKLLLEIYDRTGRLEADNIASVCEEGKTLVDKLLILADLCIWAADYENAKSTLIQLLNAGQEDINVWQRFGRIDLLEKKYDETIKLFEKKLTEGSKSTDFLFLLVRAYIFTGRWKDAEKLLARIVQMAFTELSEKKAELMMSMLQRNTPPPRAKLTLDTAVRFLHLLVQIREHPLQRCRLLVYGKDMIDNTSFQLYPDILVPSGTTTEDLLHWSKTSFDDLFPKEKEIVSCFMSDKVIQSTTWFRPEELSKNEPGSFSFSCTPLSYEEERGEERPATPGGRFSSRYIGLKDPILTGDSLTLLPEHLVHPPPDHTASQMFDHRFQYQAAAAFGLLSGNLKELLHVRDKKISEQMSQTHPFAGVIPKDKGESFEGRLALAEYYLSENNLSAAKHHLSVAFENYPKVLSVQSKLLQVLFLKRDYTEALPIVEKVKETNPNDSTVWYFVGLILQQMDREYHDQAEDAFIKSVKLDKKALIPLILLGNYYLSRGKAKEAKKWIDKAHKMNPADFNVNLAKMYLHQLNEEFDKAEQLARKLTDEQPRNPAAWIGLADALVSKEKWDDALTSGQKALGLDRKDCYAIAIIGEVYYHQGKLEESEKNLREAIKIDPTVGSFWYTLSLTLNKLGKQEESKEAMHNAWKHGYHKAEQVD